MPPSLLTSRNLEVREASNSRIRVVSRWTLSCLHVDCFDGPSGSHPIMIFEIGWLRFCKTLTVGSVFQPSDAPMHDPRSISFSFLKTRNLWWEGTVNSLLNRLHPTPFPFYPFVPTPHLSSHSFVFFSPRSSRVHEPRCLSAPSLHRTNKNGGVRQPGCFGWIPEYPNGSLGSGFSSNDSTPPNAATEAGGSDSPLVLTPLARRSPFPELDDLSWLHVGALKYKGQIVLSTQEEVDGEMVACR
ncbi:hypothetical protein FNV43_RR16791 [Rhamnella rubrinervis]|uniref:Uncharacterized protein n=1 Tax=Rhamnella rubrinervis TaxID=2594499 RepID=A0A8K0GZJ0_9ROSA|nr:hypothetical protein FNV43_RR16791 [Rhamnella rubrinervis]